MGMLDPTWKGIGWAVGFAKVLFYGYIESWVQALGWYLPSKVQGHPLALLHFLCFNVDISYQKSCSQLKVWSFSEGMKPKWLL